MRTGDAFLGEESVRGCGLPVTRNPQPATEFNPPFPDIPSELQTGKSLHAQDRLH